MTDLPKYVLERTFAAPPEVVWRTWTEPKLLARWYGPGVETVIHQLDVRPGGLWLNEMKISGQSMYQRAEFLKVSKPTKLVCLMASADKDWNITGNPMMPDWPRILHTEVSFKGDGDMTAMTLVWSPHDASQAEITCFKNSVEQMGQGWGAGMKELAVVIEELMHAA